MAELIRFIDPDTEEGKFIPSWELLDNQSAEVSSVLAGFVAKRIENGARDERGHLLVQLDDGTETEAAYSIFISEK